MSGKSVRPETGGAMSDGAGAIGVVPRPRRSVWSGALVAGVVVTMGVLLLVSAGGALRPATEVEVRQAVFDRAAPGEDSATQPRDAEGVAPPVARVTVVAAGWLEADPFVVGVSGLADGIVEEVLVLEGDSVEAGQCVARLVAADAELGVRAAEAELAAAEGGAAAARAVQAAAEADWEAAVDRERAVGVAAAEVSGARAELAQVAALVAVEEAMLEQITAQLERSESAMAGGGASEIETVILQQRAIGQAAQVEATRQRAGILQAALARAVADHRGAERGASLRIEERRALESARAGVAGAEASVALATVRRDEARLRLDRMEIRAPIAGVVQRRLVAPGQRIMTGGDNPEGAIVARLYDPARMQVRVDVPLADARNLVLGQACEIVVEVLPDTVFSGVLTLIGHEGNIQKNTLEVKVRVVDPSPLLRPEMLTRVKFLGGGGRATSVGGGEGVAGRAERGPAAQDGTVLVPPSVVQGSGESARVWVVRQRRGNRGFVEPLGVRVEGSVGEWLRVAGGARAGDLLVSMPEGLAAGAAVRVRGSGGLAGGEGNP